MLSALERILLVVGLIFSLLTVCHYILTLDGAVDRDGDVLTRDFLSFYTAARMAAADKAAAAYDADQHHAHQALYQPEREIRRPWYYPPATFLLVIGVSALPLVLAYGVWAVCGVLAFLLSMHWLGVRGPPLLLALAPPVGVAALVGQMSLWISSLFALAIGAMLKRQGWLAGLCLGLMTIKPQLGLMMPVALVASRQWSTIIMAVITAVGLHGLAYGLFGLATYEAFLKASLEFRTFVMGQDPLMGDPAIGISNLYGLLRTFHVPAGMALMAQGGLALGMAIWVWSVWRRGPSPKAATVLILATALGSPYIMAYELVTLVLAVGLMFTTMTMTLTRPEHLGRLTMIVGVMLSGSILPLSHILGWQIGLLTTLLVFGGFALSVSKKFSFMNSELISAR